MIKTVKFPWNWWKRTRNTHIRRDILVRIKATEKRRPTQKYMFSCYLLYDGEEQTIQWPKRTKRQTMIYKTLHSNLKIEQHGSNL